jgi:putative ABC transport system permease protein
MNLASRASAVQGLVAMASNPLRSALCTLGVVIGIASVIATLALADGVQQFARDQIAAQTDVQGITVSSKTHELIDGFSFPTRHYPVFGLQDAADLGRAVGSDVLVTMSVGGQAVVSTPTAATHVAAVSATSANYLSFGKRDVLAGRYFTEPEVTHNAPVVVLSYKLAAEMSPDGVPVTMIGRDVRVHGTTMTTIGVMPAFLGETGYEVFIPLRAAGKILGVAGGQLLPTLLVHVPRLEAVDQTKDDVISWLAGRYRDWEAQVSVTTALARLAQTKSAMRMMKLVLGALAAISLVVGGVGIMNVLLAGVTERTREIGVRKALGARRRDILIQFLSEAIAMSSLGSGIGTILGLLAASGVAVGVRVAVPGAELHAQITIGTVLTSVMSSVVIGLTFGTFPALRAARLSPIDAIRHE